jgi:hypothetical protein
MPSYHPYTPNDDEEIYCILYTANVAEEIYTGKYVLWHRVHPQKQHTSLQNRKITFFYTYIDRGPDSSLCHKAYQKHKQANLHIKLGPHKHGYNKHTTYHTV